MTQVTVASATRSTGFCFTVRIPFTLAGTFLPGSSGPAISTPFTSKVTQRLASTSVSR